MLDQQPVGALAAVAIAAHAHQHPTALHALAFEGEFQIAAVESTPAATRPPSGTPVTAVPKLHGAAAILTRGNGALEIAVIERMILHLDGQTFVRRDRREGPRVTAQDLNTPSSSSRRS